MNVSVCVQYYKQPHPALSSGCETTCRNSSVHCLIPRHAIPACSVQDQGEQSHDREENEEHLHVNWKFSLALFMLFICLVMLMCSWRQEIISVLNLTFHFNTSYPSLFFAVDSHSVLHCIHAKHHHICVPRHCIEDLDLASGHVINKMWYEFW